MAAVRPEPRGALLVRVYGLPGLTTLVYLVAVWYFAADWSRMWSPVPVTGESWPAYRFFLVTLIGAQMTPYEMVFFSFGAIDSRWRRKDLVEMRVNVVVGSALSGLLPSPSRPSPSRPSPSKSSSTRVSKSSTSHHAKPDHHGASMPSSSARCCCPGGA